MDHIPILRMGRNLLVTIQVDMHDQLAMTLQNDLTEQIELHRTARPGARQVQTIGNVFQEDFAAVLDAWLIGLVAWVAAWGGVMLVHYFWIEKRWPGETARLFARARLRCRR